MGTKHLKRVRKKDKAKPPVRAQRIKFYVKIGLGLFFLGLSIGLVMWLMGISVPSWGYGRPDAY